MHSSIPYYTLIDHSNNTQFFKINKLMQQNSKNGNHYYAMPYKIFKINLAR